MNLKLKQSPLMFALALTLILGACTPHVKRLAVAPLVSAVVTTEGALKPSVAPDAKSIQTGVIGKIQTTEVRSINAKITIKKDALFGQSYFYGADLQYSSIYDKSLDLYNQSSAFGHIPAFFRRNGNEVQLIADNRRLFPSDVNHPERLISRYQVLSESESTITLSEANSSEFLVTTVDASQESPRDHWARSFQYVEKGNYLLQETSVVLKDGTIAEIMESVFPQSTLTPTAQFQTFEMDPNDAVGGSEGVVARYRLLPGEGIFNGKSDPTNGELKTAFAQHFDIGENKTIDWYVTPNIKDEHLEVVKQAVEGWNRYFKSFDGIGREVLKFKGRVPKGVKVGDPRYNIINWDSRLIAGAAYESQANDPFTGKQSHSVIYMPVAWFTIGMKYWTTGQYSEAEPAKMGQKKSTITSAFKKNCLREIRGAAEALNSGRMKQNEAEVFSIQLMKQTLFHEVGHALGLAHNFKGSLTFNRQDPKSIFASSIMDYNDYEIERQAFTTTTSSDGPLLEYDRQALSAIYNQMKDVKANDAVMPVCNDFEADTASQGAVDPLCIRYDIEKDPTLSIKTAFDRLNEAKVAGDVTLAEALENVKSSILSDEALRAATDPDAHINLAKTYMNALYGVIRYYVLGGKASYLKVVKTNLKSMVPFEEGVLEEGYSEKDMRTRAVEGVKAAMSMKELSPAVKASLLKVAEEGSERLMKTTFATANASISLNLSKKVKEAIIGFSDRSAKDATNGLVKLRISVVDGLALNEDLPFYFGKIDGVSYDFESTAVSLAFDAAMDLSRAPLERLHATKTLASYGKRPTAVAMIAKLREQVDIELKAVSSNADREFTLLMRELLK